MGVGGVGGARGAELFGSSQGVEGGEGGSAGPSNTSIFGFIFSARSLNWAASEGRERAVAIWEAVQRNSGLRVWEDSALSIDSLASFIKPQVSWAEARA